VQKSQKIEYLEAYLEAFPSGTFAAVAQAKLDELRSKKKRLEESTEFRDRFSPPWIVSLSTAVQLWDRPSSDALQVKVIDAGSQLIVLGTVADGSWYRVINGSSDTAFVAREVIENKKASGAQAALGDVQRAVAIFNSEIDARNKALKSIRYGAVGQVDDNFWFNWNQNDVANAQENLNRTCGSFNCKIVALLQFHQCFALFRSRRNGWAWAVRNDAASAITAAQSACTEKNKSCIKSVTFCADGSNAYNAK
jgi:hypothetical protein